ncbi:MAG: hypothetical protein SCI25_12035 [Desulfuromonadales bacterium]|nr:hypothetical protein [Desulfuromonadales bacterium]MDW7756537.1 hypothetical protein [Desulfuromonadales bacterium]
MLTNSIDFWETGTPAGIAVEYSEKAVGFSTVQQSRFIGYFCNLKKLRIFFKWHG